MRSQNVEMTLAKLAERAGVPGRTIRLYIAQGLVPGPLRAGRNAAYGPEHLTALERVRALQREGMTLAQVRHALAEESGQHVLPEPEPWRHYALAPDVEVRVREGGSPWRAKVIRNAIAELHERLKSAEQEESIDVGR